ncbi:putative GTP-binding protein 6 [Myripristis murdjan]|uniref:Putative GTP-binding protein 6 n=1 Tax=Myripristis murdjan TaxID=586833 RepID=A0A667YCM9_9TELE|nr:putative GTP-binding protein 6 [Myripristis murdjan]XP_029906202.1 putative GTP-binding protein 6 [Myripristis murdjan]XP_029906203.1 putative GTP-binding protein 6 [Myripristis murdjan]
MTALRRLDLWLPRLLHACTRSWHRAGTCGYLNTSHHATLMSQHRWKSVFHCQSRGFTLSTHSLQSRDDDSSSGRLTGLTEDDVEDEDEDFIDDREVEELFQQQVPAGVGDGQQRIFIVHPDVKWGRRKQHLTTAELMMAEAVGLVNTLDNWTVVDKIILSTKTPENKKIFGKGNFLHLTEKIKQTPGITAVFVNVERLSALSERELEEAWGVKVLDRYSVVLHIFRCNARTKEAKLQISLAEIPLLRSRLRNELANLDQQGGGARYIGGSGETFTEVQQRLLKEREMKIRFALERLRKKRHLLRSQRKHKDFPIISVMGYTNCGKTTLIKALTGDSGLQPRNQLFATLDVTVHAGQLPSRMTVLYVDTIGFLSQLPHQLIDSFSATLEDVKHSDLIIHVRDISHPETVNQKVNVLNVLKNLQIPDRLMSSMIEVHNKVDLIDNYQSSEPKALPISALKEQGLDELRRQVEEEIVKSTGKHILDLKVNLSTSQLSWLYKEATVQDVHVIADEGSAVVKVIISAAAYGRYKKLFTGR